MFPDLSPLFYGDMVCSQCGNLMEKRLKQTRQGKVEAVIYRCINENVGCGYEVQSDLRISAIQKAVPKQ